MTMPEIREYTALALMGAFTLAMIGLITWSVRRLVNQGLVAFERVSLAIDATREAIAELKSAVEENTMQLEEHRKMTEAYVERISREIHEGKK